MLASSVSVRDPCAITFCTKPLGHNFASSACTRATKASMGPGLVGFLSTCDVNSSVQLSIFSPGLTNSTRLGGSRRREPPNGDRRAELPEAGDVFGRKTVPRDRVAAAGRADEDGEQKHDQLAQHAFVSLLSDRRPPVGVGCVA